VLPTSRGYMYMAYVCTYVGVCDPKEVGVAVCVCVFEPVKCALALSITHILRLMSESVCVCVGGGQKGSPRTPGKPGKP